LNEAPRSPAKAGFPLRSNKPQSIPAKANERRKGMSSHKLINIGFGNSVVSRRVVAIISPNAAPIKRLRDEAREEKRLIDGTQGRKTRSVIITDSNHVILSAIQSETIAQRFSPDCRLTPEDLEE
jgi:hypothetical protein